MVNGHSLCTALGQKRMLLCIYCVCSLYPTNLETDQSKDGEDEGCENDDVPQILHREDDGVHDGLEAGDHGD